MATDIPILYAPIRLQEGPFCLDYERQHQWPTFRGRPLGLCRSPKRSEYVDFKDKDILHELLSIVYRLVTALDARTRISYFPAVRQQKVR